MRKAVLAFLVLAATSPCIAKYSGGSGEPNNPYKIANVADFNQLSTTPTDCNKSFILTADINLAGQIFTKAPIAPDTNSATSGFQGTQFTGIFDGNGNIISNAVINQPDSNYIGLFGYVGWGGQIRNLGVENVNITGHNYVGGLVGSNGGTLTACYETGSVSGDANSVGGLVGSNGGSLTSCYATGSVIGTDRVGGLVGGNICGELGYTTLTSCYATGSVSGTDDIGGLVGWNFGSSLTSCYATGSVSGDRSVGGLVGCNSSGTLTGCYSTGSVIGTDRVGGLVGWNYWMINVCWASLGVTACFWDIQTSGKTVGVGYGTSTGITGESTAEMMTLSTFTSAGWDFTDTDGDPADWMMPANSYPRLAWEHIAGDIADLNGDGVVDYLDLAILADQWLFEEIPADLAPPGGDGIVNFADFAVFANQWGITNDIDELLDFTGQWLKIGLSHCSADINGDRQVSADDFGLMANNWRKGF